MPRILNKFCLALFLACLSGCSYSSSRVIDFENKTSARLDIPKKVVVFVPGYKGSRLKSEETNKTVWISLSEGLFGSTSLALAPEMLGVPREHAGKFVAGDVLDSISIVPGLWSKDVYQSCFELLETASGRDTLIVGLGYDWRKNIASSAGELAKLVTNLREAGASEVKIVAHSMGGLLTYYYLRYGAQEPAAAVETWEGAKQVSSVAFLTVPFSGAPKVFRDMQLEIEPTGLNSTIYDRLAFNSFESVYDMLPKPDSDTILGDSSSSNRESIWRFSSWIGQKWGLLGIEDGTAKGVEQARIEYAKLQLRRAERFRALLDKDLETPVRTGLKLLNVIGTGHPTWTFAEARNSAPPLTQNRKLVFSQQAAELELFTDGDNTLPSEYASLPSPLRQASDDREVRLKLSHAEVCSDPKVGQFLSNFLRD